MKRNWISFTIGLSLLSISCEKESYKGTVIDVDGNIYSTIKIGEQWWMAENLKTTHYFDGTTIPLITDDTEWFQFKQSNPGYCWYDNDSTSNKDTFGALYNWFAVTTSKLCPVGWHVPSKYEWDTLINFLGGNTIAGDKLHESGTEHWEGPNDSATNESGFTALPGGFRTYWGEYEDLHTSAAWWSSTENNEDYAWFCSTIGGPRAYTFTELKKYGNSIRCAQD